MLSTFNGSFVNLILKSKKKKIVIKVKNTIFFGNVGTRSQKT